MESRSAIDGQNVLIMLYLRMMNKKSAAYDSQNNESAFYHQVLAIAPDLTIAPDLPGCMTQGETLEEVVMNIEEAR